MSITCIDDSMTATSAATILPALGTSPIKYVRPASTFNCYGPVQQMIVLKAAAFLTRHTEAVEPAIAPVIESFISLTHGDSVGEPSDKAACWLTIRITQGSDDFKVPRWHQDGRMFACDEGREDVVRSKYAVTLLGPPTLMLQPSPHTFGVNLGGEKRFFP
jgi:hypothetical protein